MACVDSNHNQKDWPARIYKCIFLKYWNYKKKIRSLCWKSPIVSYWMLIFITVTSLSLEEPEDTVVLHFEIYWYRNQACQDGSISHLDFNPCLSVSFLKNVVRQQRKDFLCFKISICTVWWKCNDGSLLLVIVGYTATAVLQGTKAVGGKWGGCGHPIKKQSVGKLPTWLRMLPRRSDKLLRFTIEPSLFPLWNWQVCSAFLTLSPTNFPPMVE